MAGDAEGFPEGVDEDVGGDRDRLAVENLDGAGVELEVADGDVRVGPGLP